LVFVRPTFHAQLFTLSPYFNARESGAKSKVRDFLPTYKQYLAARGDPCLRRATSLAYTDADEDAERLLSFADGAPGCTHGANSDEWVETHAGRKSAMNSLQNPGEISRIPDLDNVDGVVNGISGLNLCGNHSSKDREAVETPDLDDIPDMEEIMEDEDEATAAPKSKSLPKVSSGRIIEPRYDPCISTSYQ
jgi:ubiquitin-like-conjugating enzyme ATG3